MSEDDFLKGLQAEFLDQMVFMLDECEESYLKLENSSSRPEELDKIFRLAHSIKGGGGVAGLLDLSEFAHCVEDLLTILRTRPDFVNGALISLLLRAGDAFKIRITDLRENSPRPWDVEALKNEIIAATLQLAESMGGGNNPDGAKPGEAESSAADIPGIVTAKTSLVRVDPLRIDAVLDLVGELVVIKGQLLEENASSASQRGREILALLDKTARELQDKTLAMRLTSLKPLFLRMQRIVRDLSLQLEKPIDFAMDGEDIELDRSMMELLTDPLTHLIRNAVDHGLERWEDRERFGKAVTGNIKMSARQTGGRILIEISDDGKGIDCAKVLKKAIERGFVSEENSASLSNEDVYEFLFQAGFSTAEKVTDLSGRGVGLDVVRSNVEKLKGSIAIESQLGKGTLFRISLPLTTAITDGIIVQLEDQRFVVPMAGILEIVQLEDPEIHEIGVHQYAAMIRGKPIALVPMGEILDSAKAMTNVLGPSTNPSAAPSQTLRRRNRKTVVVIEHMRLPVVLMVDSVLGQSQVVVKALGEYFKGTVGLAGASIMGDGKIALVLDVESLTNKIRARRLNSDAGAASMKAV